MSKNASDQLGIPYGTAMNQLKKSIMFELVKETRKNYCFQCGEEIMSAKDLSIEHKEPWVNKDVSLFWDLGNIAFSHFKCNCNAAKKIGPKVSSRRKIGKEGESWCSTCKKFLPNEHFTKKATNWNGLQSHCIDCRSKTRKRK